jgi:hypothetical protein
MFETCLYKIINKSKADSYEKEVSLKQLQDEKDFWVREYGVFGVILDNVLIDNDLGDILKKYIPEQIQLFPCNVMRRSTNEIWENYSVLELYNDLTLEDFHRPATDFEGLKIFWFMENIYINRELKNIIEKYFKKVDELEFDNHYPFIG